MRSSTHCSDCRCLPSPGSPRVKAHLVRSFPTTRRVSCHAALAMQIPRARLLIFRRGPSNPHSAWTPTDMAAHPVPTRVPQYKVAETQHVPSADRALAASVSLVQPFSLVWKNNLPSRRLPEAAPAASSLRPILGSIFDCLVPGPHFK